MINFVGDIFILSNLRVEDFFGQLVAEALVYLIFSSFLFHMKTKLGSGTKFSLGTEKILPTILSVGTQRVFCS